MRIERKTNSGLVIVGDKPDVEKYMRMRGVINGIDPTTGRPVQYGGKKRMANVGAQKYGFGNSWESNPYIRYGDEFRMAGGNIKSVKSPNERGELKAYDPEKRMEISGTANANVIDRMDERLDPAGVDVNNYIKNSILLADHMYMSEYSIGGVLRLEPTDAGVEFDAHIGDPSLGPMTERQRNVRSLVAQGILKTVSVGFIPHKIRAPEFDNDGMMVEPAVILVWEMLELSVVAIPCNPDATFQQRQMAKAHRKNMLVPGVSFNEKQPSELTNGNDPSNNKSNGSHVTKQDDGSEIQTFIFDKEMWTIEGARGWLVEHDAIAEKVDETDSSYRFRQRDPDDFDPDSFRTIEIDDGIQAVIGRLLEDEKGMDKEQAEKLLAGIDSLVTLSRENSEKTQKVLDKLGGKKGGDKPDDDDDDDDMKALSDRVKQLEDDVKSINDSIKSIDDALGKVAEHIGKGETDEAA